MDEMANTVSEGQDTNAYSSVNTTPQETTQSSAQSEERLLRQSEVNDIVRRAKLDAVEGYKRKAERPEYINNDQYANHNMHTNQNTHQYMSPEEVRRMAAEETTRLRDEWLRDSHRKSQEQEAYNLVNEFVTKLSTGKEKYQDFDTVTGDVDYGRFPNTVQLLTRYVDNTAEVMYELASDRSKLALLEQLSTMSPKDAVVQIRRLSQSIKDNESAQKIRHANEPLSQMRPSNTGTDNGAMSVNDYRRKYKV